MNLQKGVAVADTGFVVALMSRTDARHIEVAQVDRQQQQILLPHGRIIHSISFSSSNMVT